ncbi:hypothetical protein G3A56_09030 [Rhizobium oryzihabitans]|uniref:Uncharacterized protein n=1 Tax=Rhizobium oryzihabitans TaxID=2267833 RepID=A0A7L5BHA2_9HYPH|nr:hypothetical protein [Rhizobium oryzihabitans]QIB38113.1 hypothetical protein G3A56_09030 [Rhizobium oryzihabitans]
MAIRALILIAAIALTGCQTDKERLKAASVVKGENAARQPVLVLPAACTALMERVKLRDEPWVVHSFRWNVAADNRDQLARDCQAWADDYNRRIAQ